MNDMATSPFDGSQPHPQRARSPEEKRAVLDRIYAAWCACPSHRLGQLIVNTLRTGGSRMIDAGIDVFDVEDTDLAEACERFAGEYATNVAAARVPPRVARGE